MRVLFSIFLALAVPLAVSAQPAGSLQEALLRAKPAVALVVAEIGGPVAVRCGAWAAPATIAPPVIRETGTGWFVRASGWVVTSAQLVAAAHRPPPSLLAQREAHAVTEACGAGARGSARAVPETSISVLLSNGLKLPATVVKYRADEDLALLRLEAADMPALRLADSASLQIGDRIHIVGFPGVVVSHELLNATATMEASITNGAVSGFRQDRGGRPVIQTDAAAGWGDSGAPVLNSNGDVVGVLTFGAGASETLGTPIQGFNFVVPSSTVATFLEDTPVPRDEPSRFNAAWQAGLREYFAGYHRRARAHLAEADRLLPELPDVRRVSADNQARLASQPWLPWRRIAVGMLVLSAAGYAALFAQRWRRNRFRIGPSDVARLIESAEPPLILDVRDSTTYAKSPVRIPRALHAPLDELARDRLPADPARTVVAYCT
jgi:S1-C subfamily serine protease